MLLIPKLIYIGHIVLLFQPLAFDTIIKKTPWKRKIEHYSIEELGIYFEYEWIRGFSSEMDSSICFINFAFVFHSVSQDAN